MTSLIRVIVVGTVTKTVGQSTWLRRPVTNPGLYLDIEVYVSNYLHQIYISNYLEMIPCSG